MELTQDKIDLVEEFRPRIKALIAPFDDDVDDVVQDIYIKIMEAPELMGEELNLIISGIAINYKSKMLNRQRLVAENKDAIIKYTTPTVYGAVTGSAEDFIECEQTLAQRWKTLSPFLQTVAKRQFFGYEEAVSKTARDLGTTEAAINMARTRIKQVLNGVNENE
jgi:DNA-directed RNA polymerase specialized sigma24 family protein